MCTPPRVDSLVRAESVMDGSDGGAVAGSTETVAGACTLCGGAAQRRVVGSSVEAAVAADYVPLKVNENTLVCEYCFRRYSERAKRNDQRISEAHLPSKKMPVLNVSNCIEISIPPTPQALLRLPCLPPLASLPTPASELFLPNTIELPNYKVVQNHSERCLFPHCQRVPHYIPQFVKQRLLHEYNMYAPNCHACKSHLFSDDWELLIPQTSSIFTAQHIEDVISILKIKDHAGNFETIEDIAPNILHYCTGIDHRKFQKILDKLPSLRRKTKTPVLALAVYLTTLRTNDSFNRLSTLFQDTPTKLEKLASIAKDCMLEEFVPKRSGINAASEKTKSGDAVEADDGILRFLEQHYYGDQEMANEVSEPVLHRILTSPEQSECRKRKSSYDLDRKFSVAEWHSKKPLIREDLDIKPELVESMEPEPVSLEFASGGERSELSPGWGQLVKDEPAEGGRVPVQETHVEDQELYAAKSIREAQQDPLDEDPFVKCEEPGTIEPEPEEGHYQETTVRSRPAGDSDFTRGPSAYI